MYKYGETDSLIVRAFNSDGTVATGQAASITGTISEDGAAYVALTDVNPTELSAGYYKFDLTAAELSCRRPDFIVVHTDPTILIEEKKPSLTEGLTQRISR